MSLSVWGVENQILQKLLKQIRLDAGLTQAELAQVLAKPQSFVSKYECGERRLDFVEVSYICSASGVSLSKFASRYSLLIKGS